MYLDNLNFFLGMKGASDLLVSSQSVFLVGT